jgi:hypothetical protein
MNYNVRTIQPFDKQFKRYLKKYPSLKSELATLISQLGQTPDIGTPIGHDCYKIRVLPQKVKENRAVQGSLPVSL